MPIDARMFKVDPSLPVGTDDDLQLVIPVQIAIRCPVSARLYATTANRQSASSPSIRTCPDLYAIAHLVSPTQKVLAKPAQILRLGVVQTDDKQRRIYHAQAFLVVGVRTPDLVTEVIPYLPVLGSQQTDGVLGDLVNRGLVGVEDDGFEILEDLFIAQTRTGVGIEAIEPV